MHVAHPYETLTPDRILQALEAWGWACDGRLLALNSYENRVYQAGIEDGEPVIVKFYRPERWSDEAILEEHAFAHELAQQEVPVVAPLTDERGNSLMRHGEFRFAVFPRRGGRWPDLDTREQRQHMGRFLGRLHAVASVHDFEHRPRLDIERLGECSRQTILQGRFLPDYLRDAYDSLTRELLDTVRERFEAAAPQGEIRLHGDCHKGNILWRDTGPHFVDLDDAITGPPIQDLWMLLDGDRENMRRQLDQLLEGYILFRDFDPGSTTLIEPLRTLRILHHSAWIARRWDDPAFPAAFPWFAAPRYWEEHILSLREQQSALQEPPL
ncbi:MAG TPA: serine/threonine protein kinase [Gammaproteobacteria bacterium]|nr:serine/threonine protein kinase [Gammaproteobacteria bacterium]